MGGHEATGHVATARGGEGGICRKARASPSCTGHHFALVLVALHSVQRLTDFVGLLN